MKEIRIYLPTGTYAEKYQPLQQLYRLRGTSLNVITREFWDGEIEKNKEALAKMAKVTER